MHLRSRSTSKRARPLDFLSDGDDDDLNVKPPPGLTRAHPLDLIQGPLTSLRAPKPDANDGNDSDTSGSSLDSNYSTISGGATLGQPIGGSLPEKQLLKSDPDELWLTPLIAPIIQPWIKKKVNTIGRNSTLPYKDPEGIQPSPLTTEPLEPIPSLSSRLISPLLYKSQPSYNLGDNVLVKPRRHSRLQTEHRIAKIVNFNEAASGDGLIYHIHEYLPAKDTFLGSSCRPDELFATNHSDTVRATEILGLSPVCEVAPDAVAPQEGHLPTGCYFFASNCLSFSIDDDGNYEFEAAFPSIQWDSWSASCSGTPCTLASDRSEHHFERGDCIQYQSNAPSQLSGIGLIIAVNRTSFLIQRFIRKNRINFPHLSESETISKELVILNGSSQILRSAALSHCFIQCRTDVQQLNLSACDFYFNTITTPNGNHFDDPRPLLQSEIEQLFLSKRCETCHKQELHRERLHNALQSRPLKLLDLFAGGGGLSLGLTGSSRIRVAAALDISPSATATLRHNLEQEPLIINEEINTYLRHTTRCQSWGCDCRPSNLDKRLNRRQSHPMLPKDFDIIALGPPCPENSTLNQFIENKEDKNLSLLTALSYIDLLNPKYVVLENVGGIVNWQVKRAGGVSTAPGIGLIIRCLTAMGYQVRFGLLNAIHFGAPQRRIRFFLFAAKRGVHLPKFPSPTHYSDDFKKPSKISFQVSHGQRKWYCMSAVAESKGLAQSLSLTVNEAISDLPYFDWHWRPEWEQMERGTLMPLPAWIGFERIEQTSAPQNEFQVIARRGWDVNRHLQHFTPLYGATTMKNIVKVPRIPGANLNDVPIDEQEFEWQVTAPESAHMQQGMKKAIYARLLEDGYFRALTTNFGPTAKQSKVLHPTQRRVLTVREQARAQGFPDKWTFCSVNNDPKDMIRQVGNAVAVQVAAAIEREIFLAQCVDGAG